ncbi:MAG: ORC1-type DNA replication protein [Candidatus Methanomethylicaceae archaeon]|nr:ORC1-type DNA replication protein [Candidatus Verstraetearchaeota archaeon]
MAYDIIAQEMRRPTVFKEESALFPDHVPTNLVHREPQLKSLGRIFRVIFESPGSVSQKVTLVGDVGVGKTAVAKRFGSTVESLAKERGLNLRYIHVNCYKDRTLFLVVRKVAQQLIPGLPERGFSAQELFGTVWQTLEGENSYLLLALDEIDFLVANEKDAPLYFLTRVADEYIGRPQRLSLILITRNLDFISDLDRSVQSTLLHNIIRFDRYTSEELYDIIKMRSQESIKEGAVSDEVLSMIAEIAGPRGDARYALELLWRSGKYADAEGSSKILPEHVRRAQSDVLQFPIHIIMDLPLHERLFLLSVARALRKSKSAYVTMGEVESVYRVVCETRSIEPRKHTQFWEYLQNLKNLGILQTKISGSGFKGKTTLIGLMNMPAEALESVLSGGI